MSALRVVALTGGGGGAKLALGLYQQLPPAALGLIVNTADDFILWTLRVSPDIDTLLYTLSGLSDPERGWGRHDETWACHDTLAHLDTPPWFRLGDRDLAMHLLRSSRLAAGVTLEAVTAELAAALDLHARIWPMSNTAVRTRLQTDNALLDFQDYFVRQACQPSVRAIRYDGADAAQPPPDAVAAVGNAALDAIIICPSNPFLSIDPILAIPRLRHALRQRSVPCIAVSPLVDNRAVKGPTAKLMQELALPVDAAAIARHYGELIDGIVIDQRDTLATHPAGLPVHITDTLMTDTASKQRLAHECLMFAQRLRGLTYP